ncbi:hypothetical protein PIB30_019240 [Stylosanthes scabra]|uniref:Uncharacterized protein n=1 Tax=Stylosanthes scabra TaxID=79078 RepID=A0ABU6R8K9_9FABA|nr:hypothetical protein [Stylosanthes scabra]
MVVLSSWWYGLPHRFLSTEVLLGDPRKGEVDEIVATRLPRCHPIVHKVPYVPDRRRADTRRKRVGTRMSQRGDEDGDGKERVRRAQFRPLGIEGLEEEVEVVLVLAGVTVWEWPMLSPVRRLVSITVAIYHLWMMGLRVRLLALVSYILVLLAQGPWRGSWEVRFVTPTQQLCGHRMLRLPLRSLFLRPLRSMWTLMSRPLVFRTCISHWKVHLLLHLSLGVLLSDYPPPAVPPPEVQAPKEHDEDEVSLVQRSRRVPRRRGCGTGVALQIPFMLGKIPQSPPSLYGRHRSRTIGIYSPCP